MDKIARTERFRLFLLEALPPPLTPASQHVQIFDGYVQNTRLRIRSTRDPQTRLWSRSIQQKFRIGDDTMRIAEIHLNDGELSALERMQTCEIRKNRYFYEFDGRMYRLDVYLGMLSGLITAWVEVDGDTAPHLARSPDFASMDVTSNPFFDGTSLAKRTWAEVEPVIAASG